MRASFAVLPLLGALVSACESGGVWMQRGPTASPSSLTLPGAGLSGRLTAIAVMPSNPDQMMVGSPGGGVWRTADGGATWTRPQNYALADFSIMQLEWDRETPGRLFAVTMSDIYATTDFGDHWTNLTHNGGTPAPLNKAHPVDMRTFVQFPLTGGGYAEVWGRPCDGMWYSLDGSTFTQAYPFAGGASNVDNCILAIAADENDGTLYISTHGGGYITSDPPHIFRSSCTWSAGTACVTFNPTPASNGWPNQWTADALVWTGTTGGIAAATTDETGLLIDYVSDDHAASWHRPGTEPYAFARGGAVARAPDIPGPASRRDGPRERPDVGVRLHRSGCRYVELLPRRAEVRRRVSRPASDEQLTSRNSHEWPCRASTENGHAAIMRFEWTPGSFPREPGTAVSHNGIVSSTLYSVEPVQRPGGSVRLFAGSQDNDATCSDDGGVTWTMSGAPFLPCGDLYSIVASPSHPDRVYARSCDVDIFLRSDNAASAATCADVRWTSVSVRTGLPGAVDGVGIQSFLGVNAVTAVHPTNRDFVVFANAPFAAISTDGTNFHNSPPLPDGAVPICVAVDSAGAIYAGTEAHGAYVSTDSGASWQPLGLNASSPAFVMKVLPVDGVGIFLATSEGIYRRRTGETTWTNVTPENIVAPGIAYAVSDITVDPRCSSRMYAAKGWVGSYGHQRGGVIASDDNGTSWYSITSGLDIHQGPITYVKVDPSTSRYVYAATWGQGAWVYDLGTTPKCP